MNLAPEVKADWENKLQQAQMIDLTDSIVEHVKGDYWDWSGQTRGRYFFTKEKLVFVGGLAGSTNFAVKYSNIKEAKLKLIRFFLPTGILVIADDPESGKQKKYVLSLMKRKEWLALIREKAGLSA